MKLPDVLGKHVGGMSLGGWLRLFFVLVVGGAILSYISPKKTNRSYLKELIETGSIEKAASGFVRAARNTNAAASSTDVGWAQIEMGLSQCMVKEANSYVSTIDPYLDARANKETPHLLAARFLRACGATE